MDYQNITGYSYTQHFFYSTTSNIICYDTKTAAVSSENNMQQNTTLKLSYSMCQITTLLYKIYLELYDAVMCPQHLPQGVILHPLACPCVLITLHLSIPSVHTKVDSGNHVINSLAMSVLGSSRQEELQELLLQFSTRCQSVVSYLN